MKIRIAAENAEAEKLIPPAAPDGSGIGVNYADAYIKPLNVETEDGRKITCKRKGLKILISIGDKKGEAIMRRVDHGPDVRDMLREALVAATAEAGAQFMVEDNCLYLEV
ncbi:MAG: hypothetical protein MK171_12850 [Pirellulales bacterium]|nr:hypothetical protein [Pirellulales bacterium]